MLNLLRKFAEFCTIFLQHTSMRRIYGFSLLFPRLFDILQIFVHILNGNVKGFQKMSSHILEKNIF